MSEKIKLSSGNEFNLLPMGILEKDSIRYFTVQSTIMSEQLKNEFSNVDDIQYILEDGSTYKTYTDCIELWLITENLIDGTYTIGIYYNQLEKDNKALQSQVDALTASAQLA